MCGYDVWRLEMQYSLIAICDDVSVQCVSYYTCLSSHRREALH